MVTVRTVDYRIPGSNQITLSNELADEIRERFQIDRDNRFQLFLLAAGLRRKYQTKKAGPYVQEFQDWYKKQKFKELFGSLTNFTKYASAGDVVAYTAKNTSNPDKYLKRLPVSVGTLYEISLILGDRKNGKDDFKLCLQFTAKRKSVDAPRHRWTTRYPALINPKATEAQVRNWRRQWNEPPPEKVKKSRLNIPLGTIYVSGKIFAFWENGDKADGVDLPEVEDFLHKLKTLFTDENGEQFRLTDEMDYITDKYFRQKEKFDPARNLLAKKGKTKSANKKAPKKG
jgi:hypothetical protein